MVPLSPDVHLCSACGSERTLVTRGIRSKDGAYKYDRVACQNCQAEQLTVTGYPRDRVEFHLNHWQGGYDASV